VDECRLDPDLRRDDIGVWDRQRTFNVTPMKIGVHVEGRPEVQMPKHAHWAVSRC
jgi:hypothetical protein